LQSTVTLHILLIVATAIGPDSEAEGGLRQMNATTPATAFTMVIGQRRYAVASLTEASSKFCAARDRAGTGASQTPTPILYNAAGVLIAHISYNGRVWAGHPHDWTQETKPLQEAAG
jgi:hypothetical protein